MKTEQQTTQQHEQDGKRLLKNVSTPDETAMVAALAEQVWNEHYLPIIGHEQVAYMLAQFQSQAAIAKQINNEGYRYFLVFEDEKPVGYMAIKAEKEQNQMFLSKLYLLAEARGRGLAKAVLKALYEICRKEKLPKISLTVNKHNAASLAAYKKMGFSVVREQEADIGGGFVMDDFIMERAISV